jgi:hypothetical protein
MKHKMSFKIVKEFASDNIFRAEFTCYATRGIENQASSTGLP